MTSIPKISIIVPIYNVEEFLEECLDSLVNQTLTDIEVLMVNDGSLDSSEEIARKYDEEYENFHLINKENGGLGQARNYGVPYAKGEYIAFMDSDDYVSETAYEIMYEMAKKTNNDIVIGNVVRFNSQSAFGSGLHKKVFKETIEHAHITTHPELINDTTAWNKLFKRSFWLDNEFKFPEGILYEDIPVTVPAHFKANGVSILEDVIYYWRVRDGISRSITQNRTDIKNFLDRLYVMTLVNAFYEANVTDETSIYHKDYKWLDVDLMLYINELLNADTDYQTRLVSEVREFIKTVSPQAKDNISSINKLKYYYIEQNNIEGLLNVIRYQKDGYKSLVVTKKGEEFIGEFPFEDVPAHLFVMNNELKLAKEHKKITKLRWEQDELLIEGYVYLPRVSVKSKSDVTLTAKLVDMVTGLSYDMEVEMFTKKSITQKSGIKTDSLKLTNRLYNYDWSGFKTKINFKELQKEVELSSRYKVLVDYEANGIKKQFYLGEPAAGAKTRPKPLLINTNKITCHYTAGYDLVISTIEEQIMINELKVEESNILLTGWTTSIDAISLVSKGQNIQNDYKLKRTNAEGISQHVLAKYPQASNFEVTIPLSKQDGGHWNLYYTVDGEFVPVSAKTLKQVIYHTFEGQLVEIGQSLAGRIWVSYKPLRTYVNSIKWDEQCLNVETTVGENYFEDHELPTTANVRLVGQKTKREVVVESAKQTIENGKVTQLFKLPFNDNAFYEQFTKDKWVFNIEYHVNNEVLKHTILSGNNEKAKQIIRDNHKLNPYTTKAGHLAINVKLHWNWYEKGPKRREAIERYIYPMLRMLPINKKKIVFESWWAQKYHCNPRALYEYINENYPEYECIWSVEDENIKIKGNAKKVRKGSLAYFYQMATSKFFVNNVNFSDSFVKRQSAIEIQTMHGTPLKTLGLDVVDEFPTQGHVDRFLRRCARWDYLVVQSDTVADITRSCYAFEKDYLKVGYPRNDVMFENNNEAAINKIKEELNIPTDKKVILYAPTWRIKNKFDFMFDVEELKAELGSEYVFLMRIHPFALKGFNNKLSDDFIINVSNYPSVENLYLISDICISDYSSVMFDYANLNRPMLFFTYDLELYRDNLRGFNLDFEAEAPGPLLKTSDEVIEAIKNIDEVKLANKERMDAFRNKYCQYETGHASEQIIKEVFLKHK